MARVHNLWGRLCLEFDGDLLMDIVNKSPGWQLLRVEYGAKSATARVERLMLNMFEGFRAGTYNSAEEAFGWYKFQLRELAPTLKHAKFEVEQEWRLTFSPLTDAPAEKDLTAAHPLPRWRVGKSYLIPYVEFDLDAPGSGVIAGFAVGPGPNAELATRALLKFVYQKGYPQRLEVWGPLPPPGEYWGYRHLMKIAGALIMVLSAMAACLLLLIPTSGSVLGISYTCGAPILTILASSTNSDSIDNALLANCKQQSYPRVIAGGLVGTIGLIAGGIMLGVGAQRPKYEVSQPPQLPPNSYIVYPPPPWNVASQYDPNSPWNQQSQWDQNPPNPGPPCWKPPTS